MLSWDHKQPSDQKAIRLSTYSNPHINNQKQTMRLDLFTYGIGMQSWSDTHVMNAAHSSVYRILFPAIWSLDICMVHSINASLDCGNFHCALWEVMDVFEKDNKIGQNEELHFFSSHAILFLNINNKALFTTNIYQTIPERENYLKNSLTSFLLADEERAMEKCKLVITQISKCWDGDTQVAVVASKSENTSHWK